MGLERRSIQVNLFMLQFCDFHDVLLVQCENFRLWYLKTRIYLKFHMKFGVVELYGFLELFQKAW